MRAIQTVGAAIVAVVAMSVSSMAEPAPACPPDVRGGNPPTIGGANPNLSKQLAETGGVICPPAGHDPAIRVPPPDTSGTLKVIPPPDIRGEPQVQPK